ncbi:MAG: hypothetical protein COB35_13880 [Gammaproteobacteria bacterium]|nr:MAG: hypothetical protein COB35_13880 [Gammaproteobacteria bacterium]
MEFIAIPAIALLIWLAWQLYRAKQFNKFKTLLNDKIKTDVIAAIQEDLATQRSEQFPNNQAHIDATVYYWTQYPIRILQAAINYEIVDKQWLLATNNVRNSQHLMHIQRQYLD